MRVICLLPLCLILGCSSKEAPPPQEYVRFKYTLTPGAGSGDTPIEIPIDPGSLPCGRDKREIKVDVKSGRIGVILALHDAATRAAQYTANSQTNGVVNVSIIVPRAIDMGSGGPLEFATEDRMDPFTCLLTVTGMDPFAEFKATFSCHGSPTHPLGQLNVSDGQVHTNLCAPL